MLTVTAHTCVQCSWVFVQPLLSFPSGDPDPSIYYLCCSLFCYMWVMNAKRFLPAQK